MVGTQNHKGANEMVIKKLAAGAATLACIFTLATLMGHMAMAFLWLVAAAMCAYVAVRIYTA